MALNLPFLLLLSLSLSLSLGLGEHGSAQQDILTVDLQCPDPDPENNHLVGGMSYRIWNENDMEESQVVKTAEEAFKKELKQFQKTDPNNNERNIKFVGVRPCIGSQVVAGIIYHMNIDVIDAGQPKVCHVKVLSQVWLKKSEMRTLKSTDPCGEFIRLDESLQRTKRSLLGGDMESDVGKIDVQKAAQWAVGYINSMSNALFMQALHHVSRASKQVINGYRYRITLTTVPTTCRNKPENFQKTLQMCGQSNSEKGQDCNVIVILRQGKYSMESSECGAPKAVLGGDDHDYKPHHGLIGGDDHDFKKHGNLIGGDDHDFKKHGNLIGGDDHDFKKHGNLIGGDDHDFKKHGNLIGGDDHDFKPHGDVRKESNLLGRDGHDYISHGLLASLMSKPYQQRKENNVLFSAGGKLRGAVQHMRIVGGDDHDYQPHVPSKCAQYMKDFEMFKSEHNRLYQESEEKMRFQVFCDNMEKIKLIQKMERGSAKYGVTEFADLTEEEFSKNYLGLKPSTNVVQLSQAEIPKGPIPDSWDWRDHGAVTPVKNQGSCGSCWAFSVTGNVEGQWAINKKTLLSLSEQELVDCDKLDDGCQGGLPSNAYQALMKIGGLETEEDYKYDGYDEKCKFNKTDAKVKLTGAVNISQDEGEIAAWLYHNGPISIGINANAMQFYWGGIAHPWHIFCNPKSLDHGVLIVGYGVEGSEPYWIIKNSWGPSWGRKGYYYVYRGDGTCGLNTMCTSATVV